MFAKRLESLRKQKRLTHQDMADKLGITRQAYSHYENGRREPDYDTLEKIADFFNVKIDYLLGRTNDPTPPNEKKEPDELESIFFYEWDKLSEEDKQKALEHIRFLRYMAEQKNKEQ